MKNGFMLIELIVATLIASIIGTLLLTALSQETRFQRVIDMMVDTTLRVGIVSNQLEKDFMGAFIPMQARLKEEKDEGDDESGDTKKESSEQKKEASSAKTANKKDEEKKEKVSKPAEKPLEKIFYATTKGGQLDTLTFVTNNPLQVFVGKDVGVVKPKLVRVQYTLKPEDEKDKNSPFVLFRQEGTELDLAQYTHVRSYEVINGIKEFGVTYIARIKKEDEKSKKAAAQKTSKDAPETKSAEKPKVQYEYKQQKEWVSEPQDKEKAAEQEEKDFPRIPYMIEIKMTLWNMQRTKTEDFVLQFELPINTEKPQEEPQKEESKEKEAPKEAKETGKDKVVQSGMSQQQENLLVSLTQTLGNVAKMMNA